MAKLDKSVVIHVKKGNKNYEILVDAEKAHQFRSGKSISLNDVLVVDEVFYDAKKGIRASEHELEKLFGTKDQIKVCEMIIREAQIPMTTEMMRDNLENKKKQIVALIHRNTIDPKTGNPHPITRIEACLEEAKVKIDPDKPAEHQMQEVIRAINYIIPIKLEVREVSVKVPPEYSGKVHSIIKQYGKILKENWDNDGSLILEVEIPSGVQEELEIALNRIAKGTVDVRVIRTK